MKTMIPDSKSRIFRNALFCALFVVFTVNTYSQTPPPIGEPNPFFCSQASWAAGGLPMPGDVLGDLQIHGQDLQWYSDQGLNTSLPATTTMADGKTYYVTQTVGGQESAPLAVTVMDRTCGCIKEPDFETQDLLSAPKTQAIDGYNFFMEGYATAHKTCGSVITPTTPTQTLGTLDVFGDRVAPVSAGPNQDADADLPPNMPRTNSSNPDSMFGLRMNNQSNGQVVSMSKEFIAGEVFVFNFSLFLENPSSHRYDEQPYFQVRIYDENDQLVQTRCIVSNANDCVFNVVGSGDGLNVYSDWSCLKLNTLPIQGQKARVEFTVADCTRSGHAGYVFIDDLYVGDDANSPCNNISFGYLAINSLAPSIQGGGACYVTQTSGSQGVCSAGLNESLPFPIDVCGEYKEPISTGSPATFQDNELVLNILQNGVVVGTLNNATVNRGTKTFCFTVDETDVNVSPAYGDYSFQANIDYGLNCGDPYDVLINDRNTFQACPSAGCAPPIVVCDATGTGIGEFDLTLAAASIRNGFTATDVDLSYYRTEADAYAETNEITNRQNYSNTNSPYNQTIYVRLDWKLTAQGCTYLVKLDLLVNESPQFDFPEDTIVGCGANMNIPLVATPDNLADMNNVNYAWYLDGARLPHFGSIYYATEPGTYEVTISNDVACEVTRSIVVEQADFSVSLGDDAVICGADRTLTATITDNGSTPAIDPSLATYVWNTGETTSSIEVTQSGDYSVEVTYKGCTETASVKVIARPEVTLGTDFKMCVDDEMVITANTDLDAGSLEYVWYREDVVISGETGSTLTITDPGIYKVKVGEPGAVSCIGEDQIVVEIYDNKDCIVPQGISPGNGDDLNQNWDLTFLDDRTGISGVEIFNRHGRSVYSKTGGYTNEWFGQTNDGDELVTGTYYYVIKLDAVDEALDKQVLTGWVYVNRQIN